MPQTLQPIFLPLSSLQVLHTDLQAMQQRIADLEAARKTLAAAVDLIPSQIMSAHQSVQISEASPPTNTGEKPT